MRKNLVDAILVVCALVVTGLAVRNQFATPKAPRPRADPQVVAEWMDYQVPARRIGSDRAPVSMVVFSDYQCPFCRNLWSVLDSLVDESPERVAVTVRHLPIDAIHPQARQASSLAECARVDGRFHEADSLLFVWPDSVKLARWESIARAAGVRRPAEMPRCMKSREIAAIVAADSSAADRLGARGTPMLLINDRLVRGYVDLATLKDIVRKVR